MLEQGAAVIRVVREGGDANTGRNEHFLAAEHERRCEGFQNTFSNLAGGIRPIQPRQHHKEFITSQSGNGTGASQATGDPACGFNQQGVAGIVAEGVVDVLEVIQVQEHHTNFGFITSCLSQCQFQAIQRKHPVGKSGKDVVVRLPQQLLLVTFADTDVFPEYQVTGCFAVVVLDGGDHELFPVALAISPGAVHFTLPYAHPLHLKPDGFPKLPGFVGIHTGVNKRGRVLADDFRRAVPRQLAELPVCIFNAPLPITDQNRRRALVDGFGEFSDFGFIPFPPCHVIGKAFAHLVNGFRHHTQFITLVSRRIRSIQF